MYAEKLPPHDVNAEEAVIGSLLIDGESIHRIASVIKPDDFYRERNRWCFDACVALYQRGEAINQLTVAHELNLRQRLDPVGGQGYLSQLIATVPTSVHVEHFARIVNRTATMRRLIQAAGDIANIGYEGTADVDNALNHAEDLLFRIRSTHQVRDFVTIREVLDQYLEHTTALDGAMDMALQPIRTGFVDLDRVLGGLQRGDLVIIAARPSLGKSTLAVNIAQNAAQTGATVAIFSLEMSREQLALRMLATTAEVEVQQLRLSTMGIVSEAAAARITTAVGELSDLSIYLDDSSVQSVTEMRSKARRLHVDRAVDLVIVDYLQLIAGSSQGRTENRVMELGEITRSLKALARDLNVPVIAISQLSRAIEQRPDHFPQLSDLRESGSIEQDADVVLFIHRQDRYETEEQWAQRHPTEPYPENLAQLVISKNRHGPTNTPVTLYFRGRFFRFENLNTDLLTRPGFDGSGEGPR